MRTIYVSYPPRAAKFNYDLLTTITRGQIILGTQREKSIAAAKNILGNYSKIDTLQTLREKQEYAAIHNRCGDAIIPSYAASCPGVFNFGAMEKYIDSVYDIITLPLAVEIFTNKRESFLCLMLTDKNESFLSSFLTELDNLHVPYKNKRAF